MAREIKWLVGVSLAGLSLFQLAANTRVEVRVSAAASSVLAGQA